MTIWLAVTFVYALGALGMFLRQNQKDRIGGPICKAKGFWLSYTIYVWFLLLPFLICCADPPAFILQAFYFLTLSMWVRGIIELYMLFVTHNWTPPLGISHDIFTLLGILLWPKFSGQAFPAVTPESTPWIVFYLSLVLSLTVETYYAYAFFELVKEKTKGKMGIWYADAKDPKFARIIKITTFFNFILYGALIYLLVNLVAPTGLR